MKEKKWCCYSKNAYFCSGGQTKQSKQNKTKRYDSRYAPTPMPHCFILEGSWKEMIADYNATGHIQCVWLPVEWFARLAGNYHLHLAHSPASNIISKSHIYGLHCSDSELLWYGSERDRILPCFK